MTLAQELEGVDFFEPREELRWEVVTRFGLVEDVALRSRVFAFASGHTDERDVLVAYELLSLQQAEHAMAEQLLSAAMIEIGHGHPLPDGIPSDPRTARRSGSPFYGNPA